MTSGSIFARPAHVLSGKNSISICLPNNPTFDAVAAGTALYMGLSSLGKSVGLSCETTLNPDFGLVHQDKAQNALIADGNNLVVSFPYQEGSVDKVTYNIDSDTFNLIIQPREGFNRLDPNKVNFSYTGGKPEVIVTIYAPTLNSLGKLYTAHADQFTGVDIINIDRHFTNGNFGTINVVDKKSPSMSEMVLALLNELKVNLDRDMATNLYAGIAAATNNFTSHSVSAETFESIAMLLKSGAVKKPSYAINRQMGSMSTLQSPGMQPQFGQGPQGPSPFGGQYGQQMNQPQQMNMYQQYPQMPSQIPSMPVNQGQFPPMKQNMPAQQPQTQGMNPMNIQSSFGGALGEEPESAMAVSTMSGPSAEFNEISGSSQKVEMPQVNAPDMIADIQAEPEIEFVENKEIKPQEVSDVVTNNEPQKIPQQQIQQTQQDQKKTPKDWLKPKIFKGTNLV